MLGASVSFLGQRIVIPAQLLPTQIEFRSDLGKGEAGVGLGLLAYLPFRVMVTFHACQ